MAPVTTLSRFCYLLIALLCCRQSGATVIMIIRSGDSVFIAADSGLTTSDRLSADKTTPKIAVASSNCCVAIGGFTATYFSTNAIVLSDTLRAICAKQYYEAISPQVRLKRILQQFSEQFDWTVRIKPHDSDRPWTVLIFTGYDEEGKAFGNFYQFTESNNPVCTVLFTNGIKNSETINIFGEQSFLHSLRLSTNTFAGMHAQGAIQSVKDIDGGKAVSDSQIQKTIRDLFRLHKSAYPSIAIREPYVIYKITKDKVVALH